VISWLKDIEDKVIVKFHKFKENSQPYQIFFGQAIDNPSVMQA